MLFKKSFDEFGRLINVEYFEAIEVMLLYEYVNEDVAFVECSNGLGDMECE